MIAGSFLAATLSKETAFLLWPPLLLLLPKLARRWFSLWPFAVGGALGLAMRLAALGQAKVGAGMLITLGLLTAASMGMDFWAAAIGARRVGASRLAVIGALAGTVCGLVLGPVGLLVGPFAGALMGELLHGRSLNASQVGKATRVGIGTTLGIVLGIALKLMLAFTMLGLFVWSLLH